MKRDAFLVIAFLYVLGGACKRGNSVIPRPPKPIFSVTDTANDVNHALAKQGFSLFTLALRQVHLDTVIRPSMQFTVFAPLDSAMLAAGYDAVGIAARDPDSLLRILKYCFVPGNYNDSLIRLSQGNIQAQTLLTDYFPSTRFGYRLYDQFIDIDFKRVLSIDGNEVNNGDPAIHVSNGLLYPVHRVTYPPGKTLWQVITTRPDLTFFSALIRTHDSLLRDFKMRMGHQYYYYEDSILLSYIDFANPPYTPTVYAPTDSDFRASGFLTSTAVRDFVKTTGTDSVLSIPLVWAADSLIKFHILYIGTDQISLGNQGTNPSNPPHNKLFSNDFREDPFINDVEGNSNLVPFTLTWFYATSGNGGLSKYRQLITTGTQNGVQISWANGASAQLPAPAHFLPGRYNINTYNGVLHEIARLLYHPYNGTLSPLQ